MKPPKYFHFRVKTVNHGTTLTVEPTDEPFVTVKAVLDLIDITVCEPCRANHHDPDDCPCDKCLACELINGVEGMETESPKEEA